MLTRDEIINYTVRMGCKRDLVQKGMVVSPFGDVFCIATLSGVYKDGIYYANGQESPKEARYYGVNSLLANDPFDYSCSETRKNIALKETDGIDRFVYLFEKIGIFSKEYFFHGRYKYVRYEIKKNKEINRHDDVLFFLSYIDRPQIK